MHSPAQTTKEVIRFAMGECVLGELLLASSIKGVVAIMLGRDPEELVLRLQRRFPRAALVGGDKKSTIRVKQVIDYIESPEKKLNLKLDIRGTEFQKRVWGAVRKLRINQTTTYKDVARTIGSPKAMRAVGTACSANYLFLAIPCLRVLRADGTFCEGWRSGRKRNLIERELSLGV